MEAIADLDTVAVGDTCVWIKEQELELEAEMSDSGDPISSQPSDPLCEASFAADSIEYDESEPIDDRENEEIKGEEYHLPLQPIVNLSTNDDDPELKYDDINTKEEPSGELPDSSQPVGETAYQCPECYFTCFRQANYLKHVESHMEDRTHVCPTCNKSFLFKNSFLRHIQVHKHEEIYIALSAVMNTGSNVTLSLQKEGKYPCTACDALFLSQDMLLRHIKRLIISEPYVCLVCDERFERKAQLVRHENTHAAEMPYVCSICEARFGDKLKLAQHAIAHTYEKSFLCEICNRRFWQGDRLAEHMKTFHNNKKRFECDICHYKFSRSQDISRHMRSHTAPSLMECPLCTFSSKSHKVLARHAKAHSKEVPNTRQYLCPLCRRKLTGNHKIISHLQNHAKEKCFGLLATLLSNYPFNGYRRYKDEIVNPPYYQNLARLCCWQLCTTKLQDSQLDFSLKEPSHAEEIKKLIIMYVASSQQETIAMEEI
ncbi:hypothetical protein V9T40_010792 [Parthenolecanium corni]|uniref:C2H2-type domain-containing protein n=1 Tax=Parthenolecanium corni TaxID=536013 RepID=A0AAN9TIQ3_9HEMI